MNDPSVGLNFGQREYMTLYDQYKLNMAYDCPDFIPPCGFFSNETSGYIDGTGKEPRCRWDVRVEGAVKVMLHFHMFQVCVMCIFV